MPTADRYHRALRQFDALAFARRVGGEKESRSAHSHEYLVPCPKCGSSRLRWNHQKDTWICWGCRRTGTTVQLVGLCLGLSEIDALGHILDGYEGGDGSFDLDVPIVAGPKQRLRLRRLPRIEWPRGVERLDPGNPAHGAAWSYLFSRGVSYEMAHTWSLGIGVRGWLNRYVVFPVFMDDGLVYWQGRACFDPPPGQPRGRFKKTLNPKSEGDNATASEVLLNFDRVRTAEHVVVVEGPFDAIKVGEHAVAMLGKVVTEAKVARLLRLRAQRFTIYLDRGGEERKAAERLAAELSVQAQVFVVEPPEGYDAGALSREQNAHVIVHAERFAPKLSGDLTLPH